MGKFLRVLFLAAGLLGLALLPAFAGGPILGTAPRPQSSPQGAVAHADSEVAAAEYYLYIPLAQARPNVWLNIQSRQAVLDFYNAEYLSYEGTAMGWTGNRATCNAGTTAQAFRDAILRRINYFRAMAGVPPVTRLLDDYNREAQEAALMMSANQSLSHSPPANWLCYTAEGAEAAGRSNLCLGCYAWGAITAYMGDAGSGNYAVGHRRWVLYPQTQEMGTGDVPFADGYTAPAANALWVFDSHMGEPRPATREAFVAWPPPGYVPYTVVFPRWSFSYAGADFTTASVSMVSGGNNLAVSLAPVANGYGENTLVWVPAGLSDGAPWPKPQADTAYTVTIHHVIIAGQSRDFSYTVTVFAPGS